MDGSVVISAPNPIKEGSLDAVEVPVIIAPGACSIPIAEGSIDVVDIVSGPAAYPGPCEGSMGIETSAEVSTLHSSLVESDLSTGETSIVHSPITEDMACEGSLGSGHVEIGEYHPTLNNVDEAAGVVSNSVVPSLFFPAMMGGSEGRYDPCICAICLDKIKLAETSQIKGCEHSYCVTCILRWALYKTSPWCPQCRLPFTELYVYRALDGSLNDYLFEESVCLLLRASWFKGLPVCLQVEEAEDYHEEEDCFDDYYFKSNVRIGNRRWGDNGYVRAGRREARPVGVRHLAAAVAQADEAGSSSIHPGNFKGKEKNSAKETTGRRAKRAQKRAALDNVLAQKDSLRPS